MNRTNPETNAGSASGRPRAAVLTYHSLDASGSVLSVPPEVFRAHIASLAELRIPVLPLGDIPEFLSGAAPGEKAVALTFDDGFRNLRDCGLPILREFGMPATVFLVTDFVDLGKGWESPPTPVAFRPLTWPEVTEMTRAGMRFGAHTRTHPDLTRLSPAAAEEEMAGSRRAIEEATGQTPELFAYPYGSSNQRVRALARKHFRLACSTLLGFAGPESDPFALERVDAYYLRRPEAVRRLFAPSFSVYLRLRRALRRVRRMASREPG